MSERNAVRLSERLRIDHECGDFGNALAGYAERAAALEEQVDRLRAERDALRNRLVAEIRKTEPGCFETATASAEAKVNEYLDAFHAAMERHREAPNAEVTGRGPKETG